MVEIYKGIDSDGRLQYNLQRLSFRHRQSDNPLLQEWAGTFECAAKSLYTEPQASCIDEAQALLRAEADFSHQCLDLVDEIVR